jgi:hypothetical protein
MYWWESGGMNKSIFFVTWFDVNAPKGMVGAVCQGETRLVSQTFGDTVHTTAILEKLSLLSPKLEKLCYFLQKLEKLAPDRPA